MRNKVSSLIKELGITAYKLAKVTSTPLNTVYCLQKDATRIPSGEIMDRIFLAFPHVSILDILEKNSGSVKLAESPSTYTTKND